MKTLSAYLRDELAKPNVHLLPLRLFIGIGWLRAAAERFSCSSWFTGEAVRSFLQGQPDCFLPREGRLPFALYRFLINKVFLVHADVFAWLILSGELLVGLALLLGIFSRPAWVGALVMNANVLLAGNVNPNAFYIPIEIALLTMNVGRVFGLNSILEPESPKVEAGQSEAKQGRVYFGLALISLVAAGMAVSAIHDFSPLSSVKDPAAIIAVLLLLTAGHFLITGLRRLNLSSRVPLSTKSRS